MIKDFYIFYNIISSLSIFIYGFQDSRKSYTLSCILESCLILFKARQLLNPLIGIIFYYNTFISNIIELFYKAAFLSLYPDIKVQVLYTLINLHAIKIFYSRLNIIISALEINQRNLNTKQILDLMAVRQDNSPIPLYIYIIKYIFREICMEQQAVHTGFNYYIFKNKVLDSNLTPAQLELLK
ncbi:uncharacterized protein BO88DRAFT_352063 [Aspergillus vadensis CBS 113365]|uniref:Transmembrane protein n=1 Tax=Aspergillus vadensis (strain CBS 113365 / IMI 142717 / IBT 24658) TaxID=1448311 RepID=A0A319B196_ASPVC|nr:hypothetical protein BO88DRAFT_352063 [Aspergillus vadensis CBS 113365]PYH63980.1 hypothetical protein BO88DRAFT_352063 [Aspergillus vadensis CBS 113365]